jgi:hypothetical protein
MSDDDDWIEHRVFLAEQTRVIRREFAVLAIPLLLVAAACGIWGLATHEPARLTSMPSAHIIPASIDRR